MSPASTVVAAEPDGVAASSAFQARRPAAETPRWIQRVEPPLERLANVILHLGVIIVVGVGVLIISDVIGRSWLGKPIIGTVELARNALVWIIFCQVPATILSGKMLRVVAIYSRLSPRWQQAIEALAASMALVLFLALIQYMWHPMLQAFEIGEADGGGALRTPMGPIRLGLIFLWFVCACSSALLLARVAYGLEPSRQWSEQSGAH